MLGGVLPDDSPFLVKVGADYEQFLRHKSEDEDTGIRTPINITGFTIRMKVKDNYKDTTALFDLSTTNGKIIITDGAEGEFKIVLTDIETGTVTMNRNQKAGAIPTRRFVFDIELINGAAKVEPFLIGTMEFFAEVTD